MPKGWPDLPAPGPPPGQRRELLHLQEAVLLDEGEELHRRLRGLEGDAREEVRELQHQLRPLGADLHDDGVLREPRDLGKHEERINKTLFDAISSV